MSAIKNLVGKRFGKLLVKANSGFRKFGNVAWTCQCDCGKECLRSTRTLKTGQSKSCGCYRSYPRPERRLNDTCQRTLFSSYRTSARIRKFDFKLSIEEFKSICSLVCHYCSAAPSREVKYKRDVVLMNGIDRVDNSKGYEISNCVSCCSVC